MQMLYNSDTFVVVRFDVPTQAGRSDAPTRGAYEIVDKSARREIFIDGALAERFRREVQAMAESGHASAEQFDDYLAGYMALAQQPVTLH